MSSTRADLPEARHGFWPSDFSAADAVQGLKEYGQLELADDGSLYWLEYRPAEGGRNVLCRYLPETRQIQRLTPEGFSVCSRVHEYGGLSWCLAGTQLYFVNSRDQQLWRQSRLGGTPHPVSHESQSRFAAPCWDRQRRRLLAVEELHRDSGVVNRLVAVSGHSGAVEVLHQQHDFYGAPVLSDDGGQLAWISWDHPDQPWTRTLLYRARIDPVGGLTDIQRVAGHEQPQALTQPMFDRRGQLYAISDRDNWWALYGYPEGASAGSSTVEVQRLLAGDAVEEIEYAAAPWQLGLRTLCLRDDGSWIGCGQRDGRGLLLHHRPDGSRRLAEDYSHFRWPVSIGNHLYCVAGSETRLPAILQVSLDDGRCRVLSGGDWLLPADGVSRPEHLSFPVDSRERAYAFFYPPSNGRSNGPVNGAEGLPPLLIVLHGGPTAASYPVLSPMIQYWTQRGFAVADLNYRGSTGYGRAYRLRLKHNWGVTDVADAAALIDHLAGLKLIDPQQVFIRGHSAGGFTTLAALAGHDRFRAGASLYGVSDLLKLREHTHKFESRYLDWLIGTPQQQAEHYSQRSPLNSADRIRCPVIFFQGMDDPVVPLQQTEAMVAALKANGVEVSYHLFAGEQHGFRKPQNQQRVLEEELAFYRRALDNG